MMKKAMFFKRKSLVSAVSLALFGASHATLGYAQAETRKVDAAKDRTQSVETITVTAQGRKEDALKIPYNISAISGEDLEDRKIVDQTELLRSVVGASVVDRGYRNSSVINGVTIRGLNANSAFLGDMQTSAVPTVSTYVNSTPLFANFLIKDIERVEVLRGPQGTLYGSGSLGGTVRYITRLPELNKTSGRLEGSLSKTDGSGSTNKTYDVMFNFPLGDMAAARIVAGRVDNAGIIDYVNIYKLDSKGAPVAPSGITNPAAQYESKKDADFAKIDYARVSLLMKPTSTFSALLTYQNQSDDVGGRRQPTRGLDGYGKAYGKYENGSVQLEPSTRDVKLASLEMDLDLGFATLSSGTSHYDQSGHSTSENTGFYAKNRWLADYYYNYPRPLAAAERSYGDKALVQEFRLISTKGGAWDYLLGAYYLDQDLDASQFSYLRGLKAWADVAQPTAGVVNDNDFVFVRKQKFKEKALFGELNYHFTPLLHGTVGVRAFKTDFNNDSILGSGVIAPYNAPIHPIFTQDDSGQLYKANLSYNMSPTQTLYATVSEGYRRAGANAVPLTGIFAESAKFQSFKPDTNTNYEFGIKGNDKAMRYNLSAFMIKWKNIQVDTTTPNWGFYAAQNGRGATSKGIEADLSGRLGDAWGYSLGYAYVDAKLDDDVLRPDNNTTVVAKAGTRLPGTAKNTINWSLHHTAFFDGGLAWTNRLSGYYQSETENAISSSARFKKTWDGFSQLGLTSTLSADRWSATVYVKNLTNNEGVTGGFLEAHMGTDPTQNYFGNGSKVFISQPRTVGASVTYNF